MDGEIANPALPETPRAGVNLELKARAGDLEARRERLRKLGARRIGIERQSDRYFPVPAGRLKLRRSSADGAHLIAYLRPDEGRFRESRFHRLPVSDADALSDTLTTMLGSGPRVDKSREIWWWEDVRVHLDEVDGRGGFVEFEARVDLIGDPAEARRRLERLETALGIDPADRLDGSYGDLA